MGGGAEHDRKGSRCHLAPARPPLTLPLSSSPWPHHLDPKLSQHTSATAGPRLVRTWAGMSNRTRKQNAPCPLRHLTPPPQTAVSYGVKWRYVSPIKPSHTRAPRLRADR